MLIADKKRFTVDDYLMLEEGTPFQLINYDLIRSPSPIPIHQVISVKITQAIANFLDQKEDNGFLVSAPMDVMFNDVNVLQPDILYISENRVAELVKNRLEGAPDLIIEILSPSNAYYDLRQKKDIYEKFGVKEYIIIDPVQENADLYLLQNGVYHLHQKAQKNEILNSVILQGLSIELTKLFK
ncbi:Uma2 family endonuclease [Mucilaginibacter sp. CAU 1740]|uniref:Uma2 family endonuclease n=1 Tax=Mucilaginibacter sp. CAU 1740 TaxID=3140365 RepID=UPI00325B43EF